ncbi:hypothetical protein [Gemmiger formicilis]|uniref:hypothetical protein n=1 Tax=Gemmiger formicilis TaxID=745368 RepID=UPI003CCB47EE
MYRFDYGDDHDADLAARLNKAGAALKAEAWSCSTTTTSELRHVNVEKRAYDIFAGGNRPAVHQF